LARQGIGGVRVGVSEAQDMAGAPGARRAGTDRAGSATADGARTGQPLATTVRDEVWWPYVSLRLVGLIHQDIAA
jgi:hypothetical protein